MADANGGILLGRPITLEEKGEAGSKLVMLSPPNGIDNVIADIQKLGGDDTVISNKIAESVVLYNQKQMISVELPGCTFPALITTYGSMDNGRFKCLRNNVSFNFCHLTRVASDIQQLVPDPNEDVFLDSWRKALEEEATNYVNNHFKDGVLAVYKNVEGDNRCMVLCIKSDISTKCFAGRWRSIWTVKLNENSPENQFSVKGNIKIHTHSFEDANIQLLTSKTVEFILPSLDEESFARECVKRIKEAHLVYQTTIKANFEQMTTSAFTNFRRLLPVTKTKLDWDKIHDYEIGKQILNASL